MLESVPGVRSVVEYSVRRGKYDFALRPAMTEAALTKAVASLSSADISVAAIESLAAEPEAHPPAVTVKIAPKEAAPAGEGEVDASPNASPKPRR